MQATVFSYAPDTGARVVADDGVDHDVSAAVVAQSSLRLLRPGQRVSIVVQGGEVVRLWIVGIGEGETIG